MGIYVRKTCPAPDGAKWTASIPKKVPKPFRKCLEQGRVMMVSGPSRDFWMSDSNLFFKRLDNCAATKKNFIATNLSIRADASRSLTHWLIVFPADVVLDNYVFSNHPNEIEPVFVPMGSDGKSNDCGVNLYGMAISWKVAEKHSSRRIQEKRANNDVKSLFNF